MIPEVKAVFKSTTQVYAICPYCNDFHIYALVEGLIPQQVDANCAEGDDGLKAFKIVGRYPLKDIATAILIRDRTNEFKKNARAQAKAPALNPKV